MMRETSLSGPGINDAAESVSWRPIEATIALQMRCATASSTLVLVFWQRCMPVFGLVHIYPQLYRCGAVAAGRFK